MSRSVSTHSLHGQPTKNIKPKVKKQFELIFEWFWLISYDSLFNLLEIPQERQKLIEPLYTVLFLTMYSSLLYEIINLNFCHCKTFLASVDFVCV